MYRIRDSPLEIGLDPRTEMTDMRLDVALDGTSAVPAEILAMQSRYTHPCALVHVTGESDLDAVD